MHERNSRQRKIGNVLHQKSEELISYTSYTSLGQAMESEYYFLNSCSSFMGMITWQATINALCSAHDLESTRKSWYRLLLYSYEIERFSSKTRHKIKYADVKTIWKPESYTAEIFLPVCPITSTGAEDCASFTSSVK